MYKKYLRFFSIISSIILSSAFFGCASYGAGITFSSTKQAELGGYLYGETKFTETSLRYSLNLSEKDMQSIAPGISLKLPLSFWKVSVFPLLNIEYQRILGQTEGFKNFAWVRLGGGLDYSLTDSIYLRAQGMYTPDLFSALPFDNSIIGLNDATGYTIKLGLGWRPGVSSNKSSPASSRKPAQKSQSQPQSQPQSQVQSQVQSQSQLQSNISVAKSSIKLPNRRVTDKERNDWIAEYRALGGPTTVELEVVRLINIVRANHNLSQVTIDNTLMMAARFFAQQAHDLKGLYSGSHNFGPYADDPSARHGASANVAASFGARLRWNGGNWFSDGNMSAESLVTGWMNSEGHRTYILSPEHRFIGVGQFPGGISYMYLSDQSSQ